MLLSGTVSEWAPDDLSKMLGWPPGLQLRLGKTATWLDNLTSIHRRQSPTEPLTTLPFGAAIQRPRLAASHAPDLASSLISSLASVPTAVVPLAVARRQLI